MAKEAKSVDTQVAKASSRAKSDVSEKNKVSEEEVAYLTKRATARAAKTAFTQAAKETMDVMGFNVVAKDGWVVKVAEDGKVIERISRVPNYKKNATTRLD